MALTQYRHLILFALLALAVSKKVHLDLVKDQSHTISLENRDSITYRVNLTVGSGDHKKVVYPMIDSGSGSLLLGTKKCSSCFKDQPLVSESNMCKRKSNSEWITGYYGQGVASGYTEEANLCLGELCVSHVPFLAVEKATGYFKEVSSLWGLQPRLNQVPGPDFLQLLKKNGQISNLIVGIYLTARGPGSKMTLGGYNKKLLANPSKGLVWSDSLSDYSYRLPFSYIMIGNTKIPVQNRRGGLIDTGTSLFNFPYSAYPSIKEAFAKQGIKIFKSKEEGQPYYEILCELNQESLKKMPKLTVK